MRCPSHFLLPIGAIAFGLFSFGCAGLSDTPVAPSLVSTPTGASLPDELPATISLRTVDAGHVELQAKTASVVVIAKDSRGEPIEGATVTVTCGRFSKDSRPTDANGRATIPSVPYGNCTFLFQASGHQSRSVPNVTIPATKPVIGTLVKKSMTCDRCLPIYRAAKDYCVKTFGRDAVKFAACFNAATAAFNACKKTCR